MTPDQPTSQPESERVMNEKPEEYLKELVEAGEVDSYEYWKTKCAVMEARVKSLERVRDEIVDPEKWYDFDHVDGNPDHTFSVCVYCSGEGDNEKEDATLVEHLSGCPIGALLDAREYPEG